MHPNIFSIIKIFLFSFFLFNASSAKVFAQIRVEKESSSGSNSSFRNADTILIEQPDGTFEQQIVFGEPYDCNDSKVYQNADIMPEFIGGEAMLTKYIAAHLQYPEHEAKGKMSGKVVINFTVDRHGNIRDANVIEKPVNGDALALEALRMVTSMPAWKPGIKAGLRVHVSYTLPVYFKLK